MRRRGPRHLPERLLERLVPVRHRQALLGDLAEERALRARTETAPRVARWYCSQVLRSIASLLRGAVERSKWPATLGVGLLAYLALGIAELAATLALDELVPAGTRITWLMSLVAGVAIAALVGYGAARIRPGAALTLAVLMVVVVTVLMATRGDSAPLWYQIAYLVTGPSAALAGGVAHARSARRR